jgi:RNA polymerase sigma factor (TIGR02999 family)
MDSAGGVSRILDALGRGDPGASRQLLSLVYDELHAIAAAMMTRERPGQTLQATALVHEAYLRLFGSGTPQWENRRHFFAAAAEAMRRILVENARRKGRLKRGGEFRRVELDGAQSISANNQDDLLDLDEALDQLAAEAPEKAELVKLRYFAGLSSEEAAQCLGISKATADRHWAYARAWLYERLAGAARDGAKSHENSPDRG